MEYILIYGQLILGTLFTLIGFKLYNPFKGKNTPELEKKWYGKFGRMMKIIGVILIMISGFQLLINTNNDDNIWTEEFKNEMSESCFQNAKQQVDDESIARNYCKCVTEKVTEKFTKTQFDSIQELSKKEQLEIYSPIIESCK